LNSNYTAYYDAMDIDSLPDARGIIETAKKAQKSAEFAEPELRLDFKIAFQVSGIINLILAAALFAALVMK